MQYEQIKHKIKLLWSKTDKSKNIIERLIEFVKYPNSLVKTFKSIINLHDSDWIKGDVVTFGSDTISITSQSIGTKTYWEIAHGL